jgi:hypothetical protein
MSTLTISGNGKSIVFQKIDEETTERYAGLGTISEEIYDKFESEAEYYDTGFFESADVYIDNKHIGTVEEIIELGKDSPEYKRLQELFSAPEMGVIQNALVKEQYYRGIFIEIKISNYVDSDGKLSPDFIRDFMRNISVVTGRLYSMESWNGEICDEDDLSPKSADIYVLFNGKRYR